MLKKKEMQNLQKMKKVTPKIEEAKTPKSRGFFRKKEKTTNLP
jgi:hypothetical protein